MLKRIDKRLRRLASFYSDDEHGKIRRAIYQYRWRYLENRHLWDQRLDDLRRISDDAKQTLTYQLIVSPRKSSSLPFSSVSVSTMLLIRFTVIGRYKTFCEASIILKPGNTPGKNSCMM